MQFVRLSLYCQLASPSLVLLDLVIPRMLHWLFCAHNCFVRMHPKLMFSVHLCWLRRSRFDVSELAVWSTKRWKILDHGWVGPFSYSFFSRKAFIFCKWCLINSVQSFHPTSFLLKVTYWKNESPNSSLHPPHPLFTVLVYSSWLFNLKGPHVVPIIGEIVHAIRWHVSEIFMRCSVVSQQVL